MCKWRNLYEYWSSSPAHACKMGSARDNEKQLVVTVVQATTGFSPLSVALCYGYAHLCQRTYPIRRQTSPGQRKAGLRRRLDNIVHLKAGIIPTLLFGFSREVWDVDALKDHSTWMACRRGQRAWTDIACSTNSCIHETYSDMQCQGWQSAQLLRNSCILGDEVGAMNITTLQKAR